MADDGPLRDAIDLEPSPESAGSGRRFVRGTLHGWAVPEPTVDQALLVATELVTNAVLHAGTPLTLEVSYVAPTVRVAVRDWSTTVPALRARAPDSMTGRGLGVVSALGAAWGVDALPDGKQVWAEVDGGRRSAAAAPRAGEPGPAADVWQMVRAQGIGVDSFAELQSHHDAILRELELSPVEVGDRDERSVLSDVVLLAREVAPAREALARAVDDAARLGGDPVDVTVPLPGTDIELLRRWMGAMLDAERLARDGVLLAPPASPAADATARTIQSALDRRVGARAPLVPSSGLGPLEAIRRTIEHAPTPAAIMALDGTWTLANDAMCELVGRDDAALRGSSFVDVTHPDDIDAEMVALDDLLGAARHSALVEKRYVRADGHVSAVVESVHLARDATGSPVWFVCQVQDGTGGADGARDRRLAVALDQVRAGHEAAARLTARLAQLQAATSRLSEVRSTTGIATIILEELSGSIGADRACLWTVSRDGGRLRLVGSRNYDDASVARLSQIPLTPEIPAAHALGLGHPIFIESSEDRRRRFPAMSSLSGSETSLVVPLVIESRAIGVLSFAWRREHRLGREDSQVIGALSDQCAQALDRARLFEAEQRSARRQRFLAEASRRLASSLDFEATAAQVARLAIPELADSCSVMVVEEDGRLRAVAHAHVDPARARLLEAMNDRPDVIAIRYLEEVARTGEAVITPIVRPEDVDLVTGDEELRQRLRALDIRSSMAVPLRARGHSVGLLGLQMSTSARQFRPDDVEDVLDLADRAAVALDNARTHQLRSEVATTLQRSLLPPHLPELAGATLAARYKPAMAGAEVGGDFYDVFETGDDWALVLGDVCGKGAAAAALTAMVRYTIRALAIQRRQPGVVLARLNSTMLRQSAEDEERFCSAVYVRLVGIPLGLRVTACSAGHPFPLVVRADGRVHRLGSPGGLLGLFDDIRLSEETTELGAGDALVLYTDGVTEAHRDDDLFGDDRLIRLLSSCGGRSADALADAVLDAVAEFTGGVARDDLAILVLRVGD